MGNRNPKQAQAGGATHLTRRQLGRVAGRATEAAYRATVTELKTLQELVAQVWSLLWAAGGASSNGCQLVAILESLLPKGKGSVRACVQIQ